VLLQLKTEKGGHIKTRRQLTQLAAEHDQLIAEMNEVRESYAKLTADSESFVSRELELKMAAERAVAELKAVSAERDRLLRELEDQKNRDDALQDNIQVKKSRFKNMRAVIVFERA
jgi:chromosome segregation ATPase